MTATYQKAYPDRTACRTAAANYRWLEGLLPMPRLLAVADTSLIFGYVNGRHATPADLAQLGACLGKAHAVSYERELSAARLGQPHQTREGQVLPGFPQRRAEAVAREVGAGRAPGTVYTAGQARRVITGYDGPVAFTRTPIRGTS